MSSLQIVLLSLLAQTAPQAPPVPAKPAAAPVWTTPTAPVQFTNGMKPGETRLIDIQGSTSADVAVTVGRNKSDLNKRSTTSYRIFDGMVEPGENVWTGWRRFQKAQETDDGEISDPELTGLEADVAWTRESKVRLRIRGERAVSSTRFRRLFASVASFGLHVDLPSELAPGQECDVEFAALAQWCFDLSGEATSAKAQVKLAGIDAKKNLVRLAGDVVVEETIDESASDASDGVANKATGHYEGSVEIDYDLAAKRVVRLECKGKGHLEGDLVMIPPTHVTADTTHEATMTAVDGPAVAAALKTKPQMRDVPHPIEACGIVVTLPSHYFKSYLEGDPAPRFISMLEGEKHESDVRVVDVSDPNVSFKDTCATFLKSLTDSNPGVKITESAATSGVGPGRAFDFSKDEFRSRMNLLTIADGHYVLVQFISPEAAFSSHAQEWSRILQSLKKMPAKK
jgi:hypothetical protein